jgi:hypothetical protein
MEPIASAAPLSAPASIAEVQDHAVAAAHLEDGTIALADEVSARDEQGLHRPRQGGVGGAGIRDLDLCPDCGAPWGSSVICTKCGHSRATGEHIGQNVPPPAGTDPDLPPPPKPPRPCAKCGYDLVGLKTARCPECGTINSRLKRGELNERQTLRRMYLVPLALTGIGLALVVLIKFAIGAIVGTSVVTSPLVAGGEAVLGYLVLFPITLVVGFIVYVVCSLMFIGFDEPLGVTFLRLGAVYALTDVVQAIIRPLPIVSWFWVSWLIVGTIYVGLLMQIMELDIEDAWIVAVITFLVKLVAAVWAYATYF